MAKMEVASEKIESKTQLLFWKRSTHSSTSAIMRAQSDSGRRITFNTALISSRS
jgi:hypothetical protein